MTHKHKEYEKLLPPQPQYPKYSKCCDQIANQERETLPQTTMSNQQVNLGKLDQISVFHLEDMQLSRDLCELHQVEHIYAKFWIAEKVINNFVVRFSSTSSKFKAIKLYFTSLQTLANSGSLYACLSRGKIKSGRKTTTLAVDEPRDFRGCNKE